MLVYFTLRIETISAEAEASGIGWCIVVVRALSLTLQKNGF